MSKSDRTKRDRSRVDVGGPWVPLLLGFLKSRALAELSPHALKMLMLFFSQLGPGGSNNGRLDAGIQRLTRMGFASKASAQAALVELQQKSIVVCTLKGRRGTLGLWAVTLYPMACRHDDLEAGPGAWAMTDWRTASPGVDAQPTDDQPAVWSRPRAGKEKRNRSPRSGTASADAPP